jgi:phosphoglucomutase
MAHPRAGTPALPEDLTDIDALIAAYYEIHPDPSVATQQVAFGTSGHRGSAFDGAFNEDHIAATTQAICDYRSAQGIEGPLFIARDTHGLSKPAFDTALQVLIANGVATMVDSREAFTPTPSLSRAILEANAGDGPRADGIVVTPSHNPPRDGGFKYNPPDGGPAGSDITKWIQDRANDYLRAGLAGVTRVAQSQADESVRPYDFLAAYVADLPNVVDLEAIRQAGVRIGADPLGGAAVDYWPAIGEAYGLDLTVVNPRVDPAWAFMTLDTDGKIRMDCSSPNAMASLIANRDAYDIATGNDADADRHGIVTPDGGLMNPNHYLSVAIQYLFSHRPGWPGAAGIGKTLVSSSMIDRVAASLGRPLVEVPVGFKWFVEGLVTGTLGFGGEESAGASFLRRDGSVWTTDKDGIILALLASEIQAVTGQSPSQHYTALTEQFGAPLYARVDAPASPQEKAKLAALSPSDVSATTLAGDAITAKLTNAPGNGAALGGLKVTTDRGWFAARPSGTENVYKIYAESFVDADHLARIQGEAREVVSAALAG